MTNKAFADKNEQFRAACKAAKIPPTGRQASKWRQKTGKAWLLYCQNHRNGHGTPIDMAVDNRNS